VTPTVRYWIGMCSATPEGSDTPAVEMAAFRGSTGAGDTNWKCVTCDGSTRTVVDSGIAFDATFHDFRVVATSTKARFYDGDTFITEITTTLPVTTHSLGHYASLTTLSAATKFFRVSFLRLLSR
jgi:hypothetical protein